MLGRHGNSLFWMARYLERSENIARGIQATLHHALSREDDGEQEWEAIVNNGGAGKIFKRKNHDTLSTTNIINFLAILALFWGHAGLLNTFPAKMGRGCGNLR